MIDKSIRPDYVMQGKVKNYLGKQKMVKAPKKWKSGPDHPNTELAYITKAEKDALVKMNMYGSMNGKANKGPSGIISLNGWGDSGRGTSDASYGGGNVSGGGDNRDYGGGRAAEARSAAAAATQEAARVAAVNSAREEETQKQLKAQREMQATIAQAEKVEAARVADELAARNREAARISQYQTTTKTPAVDAREDYISRQYNQPVTKKKTNLQKATGIELIDDSVYKGTFAAEPKINYGDVAKRGIFNLGLKKAGLGAINPYLMGLNILRKLFKKTPINLYDEAAKLTSNLKFNNTGSKTGTINNISNVQDTRDGIRSNIVAGGGDVVSQKIKQYTGEPTGEKPVEQKTDPRRLQALKLLRQLEQYDSQNRLNEKGKQALAQLTSFTNKPITGRSRDI